MKRLINEVKQLQKIAGLLKEEDLDLTDNPLARRDVSVYDIINSDTFKLIVNDKTVRHHYSFGDSFGFGDFEGRCYMLDSKGDLVGDTEEVYIYPLKKGLTVKKVIDMGKEEGFFHGGIPNIHGGIPNIEYDSHNKDKMYAWLKSLKA
jgi:hypothetical protein